MTTLMRHSLSDMINDAIEEVSAEAGLDSDYSNFEFSYRTDLLDFTFGQDFTGHEITGYDIMGARPRNTTAATMNEEKLSSSSLPTLKSSLVKGSE